MEKLEYIDVAPDGYQLASNDQVIAEGDQVCWDLLRMNGGWKRPVAGQNIIGASVNDCWPKIMGLATQIK